MTKVVEPALAQEFKPIKPVEDRVAGICCTVGCNKPILNFPTYLHGAPIRCTDCEPSGGCGHWSKTSYAKSLGVD